MRFRTGSRDPADASAQASTEPTAGPSRASRFLRSALAGLALVGLAYALSRYLDSIDRDPAAAIDQLDAEGVEDALEDAATIQIREPDAAATGAESADEADEDADGEPTADAADAGDDGPTNAAFTDEERTAEEIDERAESDVQESPAEPGEMTVDEDVADELVDDAPSETGEERGSDADEDRDADEADDERDADEHAEE